MAGPVLSESCGSVDEGTPSGTTREYPSPTLVAVIRGIAGPRFGRRPKGFQGEEVWIVQHDESPHNTVLGVFATPDEAYAFMETVQDDFENGVICSSFPIGYRSTDGAVQYRAED